MNRFTEYTEDYPEDYAEESDTEVSDFTTTWAAGLFWLGVGLLLTPFAALSIVMIPIGGVVWLCRPVLRSAEADMSRVARDTGASTQSGCALLWLWCVGIFVVILAGAVALAALSIVMSVGGS